MAGAVAVAACAFLVLAGEFIFAHRIAIPAAGGEYTEAVVGQPQFINPLYTSVNDADADLASLVYSGLMRVDSTQGLVNDLASNLAVSSNGLTYTVTLRSDARFSNGESVSPKDVLFTFEALSDPQYRSPLSALYQHIQVTQISANTIAFTLPSANAFFPSLLTVGILPSSVWSDVAPDNMPLAVYNLKPIGSGPYKLEEFTKDNTGHVSSYTLVRNEDYYGQKPNIQHLTFKFYDDADSAAKALESHYVEGLAYVPPNLEAEVTKTHAVQLLHPALANVVALVFNQASQPIFQNPAVRQAIGLAIDRSAIVNQALASDAMPVVGPVLSEDLPNTESTTIPASDIATANKLLDTAGFTIPTGSTVRVETPQRTRSSSTSTPIPLSFTLTTVQSPDFMQAAQLIGNDLAAIGIQVQINGVDPTAFSSTVLNTRGFDLLLTSFAYGSDPDPYQFWDSSQIGSGGLNIADYSNKSADTLLEQARQTADPAKRASLYASFDQIISTDEPAIFLYRPTYAYAPGNKVKGINLSAISAPSDRFDDIADWYVKTTQKLK